ncbi:MAG: N-acetylmannosamine-6-phosphate 2-epimerase [Clostridiales bacterium]|nr:N-acetylmannosamine-6-phosphate 2-epimerase [Clostridiales bacterium]
MANLNRGLIVSCQAVKGEPLYGLDMMHHFARAAVLGGAKGIRANYVSDINAIKKEVDVPVIGIIKAVYDGSDVYITPTLKEVKELLTTGCEVIALDATNRPRPNGEKLEDLVAYIRENAPDVEIMADCSTFEEAQAADEMGFDYVGSTMRGYTEYTKGISIPDYDMLKRMRNELNAKVIAEGGIWEVSQLDKVIECDPYAVVIGSAITRPMDITKRFVKEFE